MKTRLEDILKKNLYGVMIALIAYLIWTYKFFIPNNILVPITFGSMLILSSIWCLVLFFYDSTAYTIPIAFVLPFTIGASLSFDIIHDLIWVLLNVVLLLAGIAAFMIKNRPKIKLNTLGLPLILASISFIIPWIYRPWSSGNFLGLVGLVYLLIYLFYSNTLKGDHEITWMKSFLTLSLLLSLQLLTFYVWGIGYTGPEPSFIDEVNFPGWGNINDLTIQLVLTSCVTIYFFMRNKKNYLPIIYLGIITLLILFSGSRASMVTILVVDFIYLVYALVVIYRLNRKKLLIIAIIFIGLLVVLSPLIYFAFQYIFERLIHEGIGSFLTGRLKLWWEDENSAYQLFKQYPLFGYGWNTPNWVLDPSKPLNTIYHSTFFHVLATGGIAGILIVIYFFVMVAILFKKGIKNQTIFLFMMTYVVTQIHGLADNTQYMIHYMTVTLVSLSVIENVIIHTKKEAVTTQVPS